MAVVVHLYSLQRIITVKRGIITVKILLLGMKAAENISYHSMHLFDSYLTR